MASLPLSRGSEIFDDAIDAALELGAYERLWMQAGASFKTLASRFAKDPGARPSDFVDRGEAQEAAAKAIEHLRSRLHGNFNIRLHGELEYPDRLREATHPVELLYYQGHWDLVHTRSVAVVGTRDPSADGRARARKIVRSLVEDGFTIVSGMARGIDTVAHRTAIEADGRTIAVLGTPLSSHYPAENAELQDFIAREHLVVSQVPIERYAAQNPTTNRFFFPERNKTMSALTEATVIVEAGETSGTLVQAREALKQGRKLFILNSAFEDSRLTWPARFEEQGAIRVRDYADVRQRLVG
ncbi:DNA-processing protein DprA [Sphingopyxis sp.]|jgi:DNA processing protein|uniref:DNA-processing protein DprA n=1 Tax=Sphingopyxis sp. TaxID=1908224 RepID=UPI002DFD7D4E|nr:DNA-processing protein DprA [Sphingopyxis sp.]